MKKLLAAASLVSLTLFIAACASAQQPPVSADAKYQGLGHVEIRFTGESAALAKLAWKDRETVSVLDENGAEITARVKAGDDEKTATLIVPDAIPGQRYFFSVYYVKHGQNRKTTVRDKLSATAQWVSDAPAVAAQTTQSGGGVQKAALYIAKMGFRNGNELSVTIGDRAGHLNDVRWDRQERVIVRDAAGKSYAARVRDYDRNTIRVVIDGLAKDATYTLLIQGILYRSQRPEVFEDFTAADGWTYDAPGQN